MSEAAIPENTAASSKNDRLLFLGCFIALITTAFGFIIRAMILDEWAVDFNLSETQKGEILGVGLWPFAISIVLFSLIIDKIGYRAAMFFALACHVASAIITVFATGYWSLYIGTFIVALGNGTVEAFINPVVATMFSKEKTKWLNILHAGWPGGLVLGGILTIALGPDVHWKYKVMLILLPTIVYGFMLFRLKFPLQERVEAGVSYREMLQETGIFGSLIVVALIMMEVGRVFEWDLSTKLIVGAVLVGGFGAYVRSFGRPMFLFLLLVMIPLATTELGTDSWITDLMKPEMDQFGVAAGWILVYTSTIMMILRLFAGSIVHRISPLGLLAVSASLAAIGLVSLSLSAGIAILVAATVYGIGKTFFWPTMLGVVSERFPKGGAMTLNTIGGVGMLSVGVLGTPFLGNVQDKGIHNTMLKNHAELHKKLIADEEKISVLGKYTPLDKKKVSRINDPVALYEEMEKLKKNAIENETEETLEDLEKKPTYRRLVKVAYDNNIREKGDSSEKTDETMYAALNKAGLILKNEDSFKSVKAEKDTLDKVTGDAKKGALLWVALFPVIMLVCYIGLIFYFRSIGGYKPEMLMTEQEQIDIITGGVEGPVE